MGIVSGLVEEYRSNYSNLTEKELKKNDSLIRNKIAVNCVTDINIALLNIDINANLILLSTLKNNKQKRKVIENLKEYKQFLSIIFN